MTEKESIRYILEHNSCGGIRCEDCVLRYCNYACLDGTGRLMQQWLIDNPEAALDVLL